LADEAGLLGSGGTLPGVKRIALLGATGSIGRQAIEVIDAHPDLELVAATSGSTPIEGLAPLTQAGGDPTELLEQARPDLVLNAVVGFAGLVPTMWALENGVTLALANKESLVAAGELALAAHARGKGELIPVDSEHSAVFQCALLGEPESIVLTASGGPFRGLTAEALGSVTPEDALAHPTWNMGPKITIDSATLANKGLEVIEAHFLFRVPYDRIEVVIHPPSIVHGLVRLRDGAAIAHLGNPDMRVPISYALTYPDRAATRTPPLELRTLEFHEPDLETFRMLPLAREAGEKGGTFPCAFNAANEVAVQAFLEGRIGFLDIAAAVEDVLDHVDGSPARDLGDLIEADRRARDLVAVA
jgi:1-deoxy-D-xylulose-5-phosphate reductoisomerase